MTFRLLTSTNGTVVLPPIVIVVAADNRHRGLKTSSLTRSSDCSRRPKGWCFRRQRSHTTWCLVWAVSAGPCCPAIQAIHLAHLDRSDGEQPVSSVNASLRSCGVSEVVSDAQSD